LIDLLPEKKLIKKSTGHKPNYPGEPVLGFFGLLATHHGRRRNSSERSSSSKAPAGTGQSSRSTATYRAEALPLAGVLSKLQIAGQCLFLWDPATSMSSIGFSGAFLASWLWYACNGPPRRRSALFFPIILFSNPKK